MKKGYIKLHRSMLDWGWYGDVNTKAVFLHLLLTANIEDGELEGVKIPRGSCAASIQSMLATLHLSRQNVRTALNHLKATHEITIEHYTKFSVITICNYERYQQGNTDDNTEPTQDQHTANRLAAPNKEYKNGRMEEYNNKRNMRAREDANKGASYDIAKAVKRAETVAPEVRKRERR